VAVTTESTGSTRGAVCKGKYAARAASRAAPTICAYWQAFELDERCTLQAGRVLPVCRNTLHMLMGSRYAPHFEALGPGTHHFGPFADCGTVALPLARALSERVAGTAIKVAGSSGGGCC
jgi:hypothetical protein